MLYAQKTILETIEKVDLTEEEFSLCAVTEDELNEIEELAKTGVAPADHISYNANYQWLFQRKLQEKTAQAMKDKIIKEFEK